MKKNRFFKVTILTFMMTFLSIFPIDSYAKDLVCSYNYKDNNIVYKIENNKLINPIKDGLIINGKEWYNSDSFSNTFLTSSDNLCPSLVIEENDFFVTVFVNSRNEKDCNGKCTTLISDNVDNIKVVDTVIGNAIGVYKSPKYFIPTFRKLSNGNIEWSINNKDFYNVNDGIYLDDNNFIQLDDNLVKKIFTNSFESDKIYRCIFTSGKKNIYVLSENSKSCKKDLSKNDNQGFIASSYDGNKGADNCKSTILGSTTDKNSVAWLLQQILNYLKILGPMIILVMSAVDFTKAIVMGDDETMQKCYKKLVKRLILAIALFFVPTLVTVLLELFGFVGDPICVLD